MARVEKPYRVYKGGRVKGKVPLERPQRHPRRDGRDPGQPKIRRPRRRWSWKKRIAVGLLVLVLLALVWGLIGFLQFRRGVNAANHRLDKSAPGVRAVLSHQNGLLLSKPTTILLLGSDHVNNDQRATLNHSDSIMLLRTNPGRHKLAYLSIPRDLRVNVPGYGEQKINAAMQIGGPALAARTIEQFTGLGINHVMFVDFLAFKDLIDNIGGIDVNVPERILSNPFDCPYDVQRCQTWKGWRFGKGWQHMDGRRALIYSRIRENQLNPADSDITRGERQQAVLRATLRKLLGVGTYFGLPFDGHKLVEPLTTDLSAWQFVQLGWVLKRAPNSKALHCRLGGTGDPSGSSDIIPSEDNLAVIQEVTGAAAAQPPRPGSGPFGPGCVVGSQTFR
jgi:polyisoprenyl-teichoic acid--peptidoglycan teichoic acid transferase